MKCFGNEYDVRPLKCGEARVGGEKVQVGFAFALEFMYMILTVTFKMSRFSIQRLSNFINFVITMTITN